MDCMGLVGLNRRFDLAFKPEQALGLTGHFHIESQRNSLLGRTSSVQPMDRSNRGRISNDGFARRVAMVTPKTLVP